jgi:predicted HicB family RNase H-like nuclease
MTILLRHNGYLGSVYFSLEDGVFFGKLEFIRDLVTFEATEVKGLNATSEEAVDDYLAMLTR